MPDGEWNPEEFLEELRRMIREVITDALQEFREQLRRIISVQMRLTLKEFLDERFPAKAPPPEDLGAMIAKVVRASIKAGLEKSLKTLEERAGRGFYLKVEDKDAGPKVIIFPFAGQEKERKMDIDDFFDEIEEKLKVGEEEGFDPTEAARALEVLSNSDRLRILKYLSERGRYFTELEDLLGTGPSSLRHHLSKLLRAGLIKQERSRGKYYITEKGLRALSIVRELKKFLGGED